MAVYLDDNSLTSTYVVSFRPGTVKVPAVCQYAHKLANLIGQSVHRQPSDRLSDLLYYL